MFRNTSRRHTPVTALPQPVNHAAAATTGSLEQQQSTFRGMKHVKGQFSNSLQQKVIDYTRHNYRKHVMYVTEYK